jgi:hypothetical protein
MVMAVLPAGMGVVEIGNGGLNWAYCRDRECGVACLSRAGEVVHPVGIDGIIWAKAK